MGNSGGGSGLASSTGAREHGNPNQGEFERLLDELNDASDKAEDLRALEEELSEKQREIAEKYGYNKIKIKKSEDAERYKELEKRWSDVHDARRAAESARDSAYDRAESASKKYDIRFDESFDTGRGRYRFHTLSGSRTKAEAAERKASAARERQWRAKEKAARSEARKVARAEAKARKEALSKRPVLKNVEYRQGGDGKYRAYYAGEVMKGTKSSGYGNLTRARAAASEARKNWNG